MRSGYSALSLQQIIRADTVLCGDIGPPKASLWTRDAGATPSRFPEGLAATLSAMLFNCRELHLIDPHFGPENVWHRRVLEALMEVLATNAVAPDVVRVYCSAKSDLGFFEQEAAKMTARLPDLVHRRVRTPKAATRRRAASQPLRPDGPRSRLPGC
jgi:hypothetical protein